MPKKMYIQPLLLLGALATALALGACGARNGKAAEAGKDAPEAEMVYDSLAWRDSVVLESGTATRVEFACIFPKQGGRALADSMRLWIQEKVMPLGQAQEGAQGIACEPEQDMAETIRCKGQKMLEADAAELKELDESREADFPISYEHDTKVGIEYDDGQYTTLAFTSYVYLAGAHGSTHTEYATFRKSDGHIMGWDLVAGMSRREIAEATKRGLCRYFGVGIEELPNCLQFSSIDKEESSSIFRDHFPLPSTPPYLTAKGVSIIYQQYEICCYAAGMPTCVIK